MSDGSDLHLQELRRGTVVLACLTLLRRLEKQGFLTSEWNTEESRPRKFYSTSADGIRLAETLQQEWRALTESLSSLTEPDPAHEES